MSVFLLNRSPEPAEIDVPVDEDVFLEIVDNTGADIDLAATFVYLQSEGGAEVLAFDGSSGTPFQPSFNGPNSATSSVSLGVRRIRIDTQFLFNSQELFTVHVVSANDAGTPVVLDATYAFVVEDLTAPRVVTAEGRNLFTVRLVFNEAVRQLDAAASDDALNPANYAFVRQTGPAVDVTAVSVATVSPTTVDITTDIEISPGQTYRLTVSNVEDPKSNAVEAPFNFVDFVAFVPPVPAGRNFDLYQLLPLMNRQEDVTEDLMKFTACLQEVVDLLLYDIDRFPDAVLDPDTADLQYIAAMLEDLGNPFAFSESLALVDKRRLARVLLDIYKLKGTEVGVVQVVLFFLGLTVTIEEYTDTEVMSLGESELGETGGVEGDWTLGPSSQTLLYSFVVVSPVVLTQDQRDKITDIVKYMKPAHTHLLGIVEPTPPVVIDHVELGVSELGVTWELH